MFSGIINNLSKRGSISISKKAAMMVAPIDYARDIIELTEEESVLTFSPGDRR